MQKKNPVIKNYILSSQTRILEEKISSMKAKKNNISSPLEVQYIKIVILK